MSTDSISPIPFYCTPFESKIILHFTAKLLEESVEPSDKLNSSSAEDLLDKVKELFLNDISLPILSKESFHPSNEKLDEEKFSGLVIDKYNEMKNSFDKINCSISIKAEIEDKTIEEMPEKLVDELKYLLLYKKISSTVALTLSSNSPNPEVISFFDSIISCLTVKCLRETLKTEVNFGRNWNSLNYSDILDINFLSLLFNSDKSLITKFISQLKCKEFPNVKIEKLRFIDYHIISNEYFGSFAKSLYKIDYSQLDTFGFGFVKELKVCDSCHRGYITDVEKCQCGSSKFEPHKNVFLISEECCNMLETREKFGIIFERYVYLNIRKLFATKQLNFIVSRNVTINQKELDIICIPAGSLFRKMLIIECKATCEDNDINDFKNRINDIFNRNMGDTYLAVVYLENKTNSKNEEVHLYSVYEIEKLIEDYIKDSLRA